MSRFLFGLVGFVVWHTVEARLNAQESPPPIRAGIIGTDTSHAVDFTKILNGSNARDDLSGVRVVAAFPGGSPDIPSSHDRVEGYVKQLHDEFGVEIVDTIDALLGKVDVVLLESVDGRPHRAQAELVLRARKPVFIDKPVAGSLADAVRIYDLAEKNQVPCFSSSALRFTPNVAGMRRNDRVGEVVGCLAYSPCPLEEHHPDLFWYGIHGVESLFTVMGPGCERVSRTHTDGTDVVVGVWKDGRIGTFRGLRDGPHDYGVLVFGSKSVELGAGFGGYEPLLVEIVKFFKTGKAPVSPTETIEILAFMEAADQSARLGGAPVALADLLSRAREEASRDAPRTPGP